MLVERMETPGESGARRRWGSVSDFYRLERWDDTKSFWRMFAMMDCQYPAKHDFGDLANARYRSTLLRYS